MTRGKTMRTLRLSLTGTVALVLLVGASGSVLAQDAESEMQAAAEQGVVFSTGSAELVDYVDVGVEETGADGVDRYRGLIATTAAESTDPRLTGTSTLVWNRDAYAGYDGPEWGTVRTENDGGAWQGTYSAFMFPDDEDEWYVAYIATSEGEGGYEGLVSVCQWLVPGGGWDTDVKCVVMPGDLSDFGQPVPTGAEPPAE
jgi:hypothetical protein